MSRLQAQMSRLVRSMRREAAFDRDQHTERERLFSAVVESSNDAIITKALDGTITGWNRAAERLFGYHRGRSGRRAHRPDRSAGPARRSRRHSRARRPRRTDRALRDRRACTRTAASVDVSLSISPIRSAAGDIIGVSKIARDITESKRTADGAQPARSRSGSASSRPRRTSSWSPTASAISSRSARASRPSSVTGPKR